MPDGAASRRLCELADQLVNASDVDAILTAGHRFYGPFGAVHLVFATGDLLAADPAASTTFASTVPGWFLDRYARENYAERDPSFRHVGSGAQSPLLTGTAMTRHLPDLDRRSLEFLEEARLTGLTSGITMPMPFLHPGRRGAVSVATSEGEQTFLAILRAHEWEFRLAAFYLHSRMQALVEAEASPPALSARQRECLLWLTRGLRPDQIAERLGLRRVTVDLHLSGARRKLHARTNEQAVARALALGVLGI